MANLPLTQLTAGPTGQTIELGGQDAKWCVHEGGIIIGDVPSSDTRPGTTIPYSADRAVAIAPGNRQIQLNVVIFGSNHADLGDRIRQLSAWCQRADRATVGAANRTANTRPEYFRFRFANSTAINVAEIDRARLHITSPASVDIISGLMQQVTITLSCLPFFLEGRRVIAEESGGGTPTLYDNQDGLPIGAGNFYTLPGVLSVLASSGILSDWFYIPYSGASDVNTYTYYTEEAGKILLQKRSDKFLRLSIVGGTTGTPTNKYTQIDVSGSKLPIGWHHIMAAWGPTIGLNLWLDSVAATGNDQGAADVLQDNEIGRIIVGQGIAAANPVPTGSRWDDHRHGLAWDVFMFSAIDVFLNGREPNSIQTMAHMDCLNKGNGTTPLFTDIYNNLRGDTYPLVDCSIAFRPNGGSGTYTLSRVRVGCYPDAPSTYQPVIEAEAMALQTGVTTSADAARSGGSTIVSSHTAAQTPTAPTAVITGTPGSQVLVAYIIARFPYGDSPPSPYLMVTNAPDVLDGSNYVTFSWTAVTGASSYILLLNATSQVGKSGITGTSFALKALVYESTGYQPVPSDVAGIGLAATMPLDGSAYVGRFQCYGILKTQAGGCSAQLRFMGGSPAFSVPASDPVDLSPIPAGQYACVNLGSVRLPPFDAPDGQIAPITMQLYDNGRSGHTITYDYFLLIPYSDVCGLIEWPPTDPLTNHSRLVWRGDEGGGVLRRYDFTTGGYTSASGDTEGKFPAFVPGRTNRLVVSVDRYEAAGPVGSSFITDEWLTYIETWPHYLFLRGGGVRP